MQRHIDYAAQVEWLKRRIAAAELPPVKHDHDTREKYLLAQGMPEAVESYQEAAPCTPLVEPGS